MSSLLPLLLGHALGATDGYVIFGLLVVFGVGGLLCEIEDWWRPRRGR